MQPINITRCLSILEARKDPEYVWSSLQFTRDGTIVRLVVPDVVWQLSVVEHEVAVTEQHLRRTTSDALENKPRFFSILSSLTFLTSACKYGSIEKSRAEVEI